MRKMYSHPTACANRLLRGKIVMRAKDVPDMMQAMSRAFSVNGSQFAIRVNIAGRANP